MFFYLPVFILFLMFPAITAKGMEDGLDLLIHQIIPSLYPFIFLTTFMKYHASRMTHSNFFLFFLGCLSGYPLGAKVIADHHDAVGPLPPQSLLLICNNPSPAYMISFVGLHCLGDPSLGLKMYLSLLFGNVVIAFLLLPILKEPFAVKKSPPLHTCSLPFPPFEKLMAEVFSVLLNLSGYTLLFSVLSAFIKALPFLPTFFAGILAGFLEMTTGVENIAASPVSLQTKVILITEIISFGGLSVIGQTQNMIQNTPLSIKKYMADKIAASAVSMTAMYCLFLFNLH